MKINITARNFDLSDALRDYITKKIEKMKRFEHYILDTNMIMEKDKGTSIIELTLAVKHSSITSRVKNPDIYMGINDSVKKVERQLEKYEAKFRERKRQAQKARRK
jgi:putative sigma-54 modulation protein